ncbi:hypothetical protein [Streptomyces sp900116325]|uniref:hypothetical protein n=1 Tax=Streptomyces sp. 900116325 TaxID=3154295 RepID=UPI00332705CC
MEPIERVTRCWLNLLPTEEGAREVALPGASTLVDQPKVGANDVVGGDSRAK